MGYFNLGRHLNTFCGAIAAATIKCIIVPLTPINDKKVALGYHHLLQNIKAPPKWLNRGQKNM